jgi:hypothetical protein
MDSSLRRNLISGAPLPTAGDAAAARHAIADSKPGTTRFDAGARTRGDRNGAGESRKEAGPAAPRRPVAPFAWVSKGTERIAASRPRTVREGGEDREPRSEANGRNAPRASRVAGRHALDGSKGEGRRATLGDVQAASSFTDALDASGEKVRGSIENTRGYGEISLAVSRYEHSAARVSPPPDYVMPRNTDDLFNEIVRQFTLVAKKGGGEAHISLKPDVFGGMKLDLKLNRGEVSSFILVDNPAVKDLLLARLTVLEQGLLQHGLSLGSFQVEVKDGGNGERADGKDGGKREIDSIGRDHVEDAVEGPTRADAGLPWMSTVINVTV